VPGAERRFEVWDYWVSHFGFEMFRETSQSEIEQISRLLADEDVLIDEALLGWFYEDEPGPGADSGLTSA
jgi:hypothetical protein